MKVTILRGISGAGKTTWTKANAASATIVSADHYFMKDGEYRFDVQKLQENHNRCFRDFMDAILKQESWIVVDNTNISTWEYSPYVLAAESYGYEVELLTFLCSPELATSRKQQVHADKVYSLSKRLDEETRTMPQRFARIHRIIDVC